MTTGNPHGSPGNPHGRTCPGCGTPMEPDIEEVDIGVGKQQHLVGYICPVCGPIAACSGCGEPRISGHWSWCPEVALKDA